MPKLFRRRQVWLPTVWGAALLLALAFAVAAALLPRLGLLLAPHALAVGGDGRGATTLIVEGWLDDDALDDAIGFARSGRYERVLTSGGPIEAWRELQPWPTYADRAADYLRRHGLQAPSVIAVPAPATAKERTYVSAVVVRDWLRAHAPPAAAVDLVSAGVHARRSRLVWQMAFGGDVAIGIVAIPPHRYALDRWWATSEGAKAVVGELLGLAWTTCCFWPAHESAAPAAAKSPA